MKHYGLLRIPSLLTCTAGSAWCIVSDGYWQIGHFDGSTYQGKVQQGLSSPDQNRPHSCSPCGLDLYQSYSAHPLAPMLVQIRDVLECFTDQ